MRDATFSRRDMLWAGGALTVGAAFAEPLETAAAESSGLAQNRHLGLIRRCPG